MEEGYYTHVRNTKTERLAQLRHPFPEILCDLTIVSAINQRHTRIIKEDTTSWSGISYNETELGVTQ